MLHRKNVRTAGMILIAGVEDAGLFLILIGTIVAIGQEVCRMLAVHRVALTDLLLLFIFLEVITMVESYWRLGKLPVRIPLYIAMVALTVFVIRFGHLKFPYQEKDESADY